MIFCLEKQDFQHHHHVIAASIHKKFYKLVKTQKKLKPRKRGGGGIRGLVSYEDLELRAICGSLLPLVVAPFHMRTLLFIHHNFKPCMLFLLLHLC